MNNASIEAIKEEWRNLGYYFEKNKSERKWVFTSSKNGIKKLINQIIDFTQKEGNIEIGEHDHWGPYGDLKIMTTRVPEITIEYIGGSFSSLRELAYQIKQRLEIVNHNESFCIQEENKNAMSAGLEFRIKDDDYDPASADIQLWQKE
jgi:hypothetical protein